MLQTIRSKAASLVFKVLFAALILSFGVWGIGDIFRNRSLDTSVATVGGQKIETAQLAQSVRDEVQRLRGMFGSGFNVEQAKQFGIVDQSLDTLISNALVNQEINRLRLAVSDDTIRAVIMADSNFRGPTGQFDRTRYQQLLALSHISEPQYEAQVRSQLVHTELLESVIGGGTAPKPLVTALYLMRAEQRVADTVFLPAASVGDVGEPSETELVDFHAKHPDLFRSPELRSFSVAYLKPDDLASTIKVSDDDLIDAYQKRLEEFETPERRHIEQILVKDEDSAQQVEGALKGGRNFATVAKDVAKLPPDSVDLGWVTHDELPAELADPVFALPKDGVSPAIRSPLGWHVIHVVGIEAPKTESLDSVKAKLASDIARDRSADVMAKLINDVDDSLAGGAGIEDTARKFNLKLVKLTDIDQTGHAVNGGTVVLPQPSSDILRSAFSTDAGQLGGVADTSDGGFYVVHVDKVTPAAVRPLSDVRDQAVKAWQQEQRNERLDKEAKEIADAINGGASLKDVAAKRKLAVTATPALERTGGSNSDLPAPMIAKLFEMKPRQAESGPSADGYFVAELTRIIPADPAAGQTQVQQLTSQLGSAIQNDLYDQYSRALRERFPVKVDQAAVDRAL